MASGFSSTENPLETSHWWVQNLNLDPNVIIWNGASEMFQIEHRSNIQLFLLFSHFRNFVYFRFQTVKVVSGSPPVSLHLFPPVVCNPLLEVTHSVYSTDLKISIIGRVDNHCLDCTTICWDLSIMSTSYGSWNQRTWQLIPLRLMNNLVVTNDTLNTPSPRNVNWITCVYVNSVKDDSVMKNIIDLEKYFLDMNRPNRSFFYFRCMFFKFTTVNLSKLAKNFLIILYTDLDI